MFICYRQHPGAVHSVVIEGADLLQGFNKWFGKWVRSQLAFHKMSNRVPIYEILSVWNLGFGFFCPLACLCFSPNWPQMKVWPFSQTRRIGCSSRSRVRLVNSLCIWTPPKEVAQYLSVCLSFEAYPSSRCLLTPLPHAGFTGQVGKVCIHSRTRHPPEVFRGGNNNTAM